MNEVKLDYKELEELAIVGGADRDLVQPNSAVASTVAASVAITDIISAITALSGLSVAWSHLYSCTKNTQTCTRK